MISGKFRVKRGFSVLLMLASVLLSCFTTIFTHFYKKYKPEYLQHTLETCNISLTGNLYLVIIYANFSWLYYYVKVFLNCMFSKWKKSLKNPFSPSIRISIRAIHIILSLIVRARSGDQLWQIICIYGFQFSNFLTLRSRISSK